MPGFWRVRVIGGAILAALAIGGCEAPNTRPPAVSAEAALLESENQREFLLRNRLQEWTRLWTVGMPLLEAGAGLCGSELIPYLGIDFASIHSFESTYRAAAERILPVDDFARVTAVFPNSPAERAGIQVGDALLKVGGRTVRPGPDAVAQVSSLLETEVVAGTQTSFTLGRQLGIMTLTAIPSQRCNYNLQFADDDTVSAYADGRNIVITRGMMRLADSDQHLAVIIGHEAAHYAMGHITAESKNALAGGLGGLLPEIAAALGDNTGGALTDAGMKAGAQSFSVAFEQEADYVGTYMLARAGYALDGAAETWRLMATTNPNSIVFARSHPTSPERTLGFEKYHSEINRRLADAMPLVPDGIQETVPAPQIARAQPPRPTIQQTLRPAGPEQAEPRRPAAPAQPPRLTVRPMPLPKGLAPAEPPRPVAAAPAQPLRANIEPVPVLKGLAPAQPPRANVEPVQLPKGLAPAERRQSVAAAPAEPPRANVQQSLRRESLAAAVAKLPPQAIAPMPATTRWVGGGPEDACGEAWFMYITLSSGSATGQLVRGGVGYDVTGEVGVGGELQQGRASKSKASIGLDGPFTIQVNVEFGPQKAVGDYVIEDSRQLLCRTSIALHRQGG